MNNELTTMPSFIQPGDRDGFDDADAQSRKVPFLKVAQPLSDTPPGVEQGDFYSPQTGKSFGKTIQVILVGYFRHYIHRTAGEGNDRKFLGTVPASEIETGALAQGLTRDKGKLVAPDGSSYSDARNHFLVVRGAEDEGVLLYVLEQTGIPVSRAWITKATTVKVNGKTAPIWSRVWELTTVKIDGPKGRYFQVDPKLIVDKGWIPEAEAAFAKAAFAEVESLKGRPIETDSEEPPF